MDRTRARRLKDVLAHRLMLVTAIFAGVLVFAILAALYWRARPVLATHSMSELLLSSSWRPLRGEFGLFPFIMGTLWVTVLAMILAVPPGLFVSIYLASFAPERVRALFKPLIDVLAGIPSVVYGVWGVLIIVPGIRKFIVPFAAKYLSSIPMFSTANRTGYSILAGGIVLAVMVFPIIISVSEEVLRTVPQGLREASLAVGATEWQTTKKVILRRALPGVAAAVIFGFSRAFGETMAVMMVVGNVPRLPHSLFDAAYPLPALIANSYGEMMSVPMYDSALLLAALVLLMIVFVFTILARIALLRVLRRAM
jgi:phosphate transport system permease protein